MFVYGASASPFTLSITVRRYSPKTMERKQKHRRGA
jgi:hypothetical protein